MDRGRPKADTKRNHRGKVIEAMAKQRVINTHFWDDGYIIELDPIEKLLFLYLLTNPLTDICGAYEINVRRIALDTGIDRDMILKILARFEAAQKITYKEGWIVIHNFVKNQSANPSVHQGVARSINNCPDWVKYTLVESGDGLPQTVLLNLTKLNSTEPNGKPGLPPESAEETAFVNELLDSLRQTLGVIQLPHEPLWADAAVWSFRNQIRVEDFIACYQHLDSQTWRETAPKAEHVTQNLPKFLKSKTDKWANG